MASESDRILYEVKWRDFAWLLGLLPFLISLLGPAFYFLGAYNWSLTSAAAWFFLFSLYSFLVSLRFIYTRIPLTIVGNGFYIQKGKRKFFFEWTDIVEFNLEPFTPWMEFLHCKVKSSKVVELRKNGFTDRTMLGLGDGSLSFRFPWPLAMDAAAICRIFQDLRKSI